MRKAAVLVVSLCFLTVVARADPVLNPATGNYYEFVASSGIDWAAARNAAAAMKFTLGGVEYTGYLATITSAAEDAFLAALIGAPAGVFRTGWVGGSDAAVEGDWRWVTGPEGAVNGGTGLPLWSGGIGGSPVSGAYTNWRPSPSPQPDNLTQFDASGEDYLEWEINWLVAGQVTWNDLHNAGFSTRPNGYFVEFNTQVPVPEPDSLVLCGMALVAVAVLRVSTRGLGR